MKKILLPLIAIIIIGVMEICAISNGLDGTVLSMAVAAIAGLAGYTIKSRMTK